MQPRLPSRPSKFDYYGESVFENAKPKLYRNQLEALQGVLHFFAQPKNEGKPAIVVMPTGTGKSGVIVLLPYCLHVKRMLILTPSVEICDQIARDFGEGEQGLKAAFLTRLGIISTEDASECLPSVAVISETSLLNDSALKSDVLISNAHKFSPRCVHEGGWAEELRPEQYELVVVDEAHHLPSETWKVVTDHFMQSPTCKLVFLTATPKRSDGKRITTLIEEVDYAYIYTRADAVKDGIIRDAEFLETQSPDMSMDGAFMVISRAIKDTLEAKNRDFPLARGHRALAITKDINDADRFSLFCSHVGLRAAPYHGDILPRERDNTKDHFENGELEVLIVVGMLLEGYDFSPISISAIATPISSSVKFQQFIGRALRKDRDETIGTKATIITHQLFGQKSIYDKYLRANGK